ncbi:hypothetical protein [Branchiibius hedensis]|uniref:hypothetical protein n=1 Tax=Branchiibius hedensis TaxID=672460 RepID=UPI000D6D4D59|nr:hypothetical protein [Branchiibius hedensis]
MTDRTTSRAADAATVDDALRHLRRLLSTSVVNGYLHRNMQSAITAAEDRGEDCSPSTSRASGPKSRNWGSWMSTSSSRSRTPLTHSPGCG